MVLLAIARAGVAGLVLDRALAEHQQHRPERSEVAVRRGWLVLKALPHVVPETSFRESILGQGLEELSHVENLPQRVPIVLTALLIAAAAVGLGDLVLRGLRLEGGLGLGERVALGYGLGAGLLGMLTLDRRQAGLAGSLARAGGACGRGGGGPLHGRGSGARLDRSSIATWCLKALVFCPFVVVMLLASMLPSIDFDVLEYHLQGPKEYYQAGRISVPAA